MTERQPLDQLHAAIQTFSNTLADDATDAGMVSVAIVVWEEASFDEDGTVSRRTFYAATGDVATPASCLGLAHNLVTTLERDLVPCRCGTD